MRYLAFDLGAESGRAVVGSLESGKLSLDEVYRFNNAPLLVQGHLHWNIYRIFEELQHGLRAATSKYSDIVSLGIDTWGCDFGLLDQDGVLIGLPLMYRDPITEGVPEQVYQIVPREEVYRLTGLQTMRVDTIFQLYALNQKYPRRLEHARRLLFMPNLLGYLFTGVALSDETIASTSHLYNPSRHQWETSLMERLGLPAGLLPKLALPGTTLGPVLPDLAQECGADGIEVVCVGSHDTASAVAAIPAADDRWAYNSSGTWSLVGVELENPLISQEGMNCDFTNEVGCAGRIRYLKNVVGLWLLQGVRRSFQARGASHSYPEMIAQAEQAPPFRSLIDVSEPDFVGLGDMTAKIDAYCRRTGQPQPEGVGGYSRCALESLAIRYREVLEMLRRLTGGDYQSFHIIGGGSKNALLNAFSASACRIKVLAGPSEATAAGNILSQATNHGQIASLEEGRQVVRSSFDLTEFRPENPAAWDQAYGRYLQIKQAGVERAFGP